LVGVTFGGGLGWTSDPVGGLFALAVMGLASFVRIERNAENLLIDFAIFRQRALLTSLTTLVLTHVIHFPIALCAPLYLQSVLGTSAVAAGFVFALLPLSTALSIPLSGPLADRFKASIVASSGIVMIVAGIACYFRLGIDSDPTVVAVALALVGAGLGVFTPANQKIARYASVNHED